jgi:UDP-sugar transporter A1/2/3
MFKQFLFVSYVLMWSLQGILVHRISKSPTDTKSIVFFQEATKLLITTFLFLRHEGTPGGLMQQLVRHRRVLLLYFIPAGLYAVYNNLTFIGLSIFDPASYFVLMQFRLILTGALSVVILKKELSIRNWLALVIVMVGSMLKEIPNFTQLNPNYSNYFLILIQLSISSFAGIYNELLLKSRADVSTNIQNFFMYSASLILLIIFSPSLPNPAVLADLNVIPIVINSGLVGVITGYFLRHLNSVLKSIAAATELWLTAILSSMIFGYKIEFIQVIGIVLVSFGIFLYSRKDHNN